MSLGQDLSAMCRRCGPVMFFGRNALLKMPIESQQRSTHNDRMIHTADRMYLGACVCVLCVRARVCNFALMPQSPAAYPVVSAHRDASRRHCPNRGGQGDWGASAGPAPTHDPVLEGGVRKPYGRRFGAYTNK